MGRFLETTHLLSGIRFSRKHPCSTAPIGSPAPTIGIVAHVDAGKTSLTERLLFDTGVTDHLGEVDAGDTQTDSGDIERRRGITIRTGVVAFHLGDLRVTLVDTPGHAEFVAEVERALAVLDAAVLVVSAVEGIQSHTRLLMRTLTSFGIPTVLFVNKLDRSRRQHRRSRSPTSATRLTAGRAADERRGRAGTPQVSTQSRWPDDPAPARPMHSNSSPCMTTRCCARWWTVHRPERRRRSGRRCASRCGEGTSIRWSWDPPGPASEWPISSRSSVS